MAQAEMACRQAQGLAGENVAGPRTRVARYDHGVNLMPAIDGPARANDGGITRSTGRIIPSGHVDFDIAKSTFRQMRFESGQ